MKNIKTYEEFKGRTFKDFMSLYYNDESSFSLSCNDKYLIDLNGIDKFYNLEFFHCHYNKITSLEPIKNLINLRKIWCYNNKLSSLKGVENLLNLVLLFCSDNSIVSLEPIKNLINLRKIWCSNNEITSLKPILNLTKLEHLYCINNPIDWIDYVDKKGNKWYIELPKSITILQSDKFKNIKEYWKFMKKNQPVLISRKFNF